MRTNKLMDAPPMTHDSNDAQPARSHAAHGSAHWPEDGDIYERKTEYWRLRREVVGMNGSQRQRQNANRTEMPLRDYQEEDVARIFKEWEDVRSTLYVCPTGGGKTIVMVEVARRLLPGRTMFLAHRTELIDQARGAFMRAGMECEIEKAELTASTNLFGRSPVVLASVQTLLSGAEGFKRMKRFNPMDFSLLLYDEAHHSVAAGNKSIVDYFREGNPNLKILLVTATPDRADEEALGQICDTVASERDILWAVDNGWLVPVEQQFAAVGDLDFSHVETTAGDLNMGQLAAVMEAESSIQGVVQPTLEALCRLPQNSLADVPVDRWTERIALVPESERRRGIVFTVSVRQAEMLCNIFNRVTPDIAGWVCGKTADRERMDILGRFKDSPMRLLVNVGVTTEGYDNPNVDLIIGARPTKSRSLYAQMIGRATRALPGIVDGPDNAGGRRAAIEISGKPCCTMLDFVGNSGKHKLMTTADVLGGNISDEAVARAVKKAKADGQPVDMRELLEKSEEEIRKEREERRQREEAQKAKLVAKVRYVTRAVNPFDAYDIQPARARGWDAGKQLSEKQANVLRKAGIDPTAMDYAQAKQLLNETFRRWHLKLATARQCALLKRHGYNTKDITMKEASAKIDALAKNGWRRPVEPMGATV